MIQRLSDWFKKLIGNDTKPSSDIRKPNSDINQNDFSPEASGSAPQSPAKAEKTPVLNEPPRLIVTESQSVKNVVEKKPENNNSNEIKITPSAILIDDDILVRMSWKMSAETHGKTLEVFASPNEFLSEMHRFNFDTAIYIDSNLGNGIKGEEFAIELKQHGFSQLYLATGYEPSEFAEYLKVLSGIVGKDPPWVP